MSFETLRLAVEGGIATVTFDRPPVNAQNRKSREEFIQVFDQLSDRDDVRVVILTAAGKVFSAGADVKERVGLAQEPGDYVRHNRITREFFYAVRDCEKPVIAAVNGAAIGAGFVLMLSCDIMLASDEAYFVMPELDVGLAGGARFLQEHFGRSKARTMYFTGEKVPAQELYRLGVIEACLPRDRLMAEAMRIATRIAEKSPLAVRRVKRAFDTVEEMPVRDAYRYEQTITVELSRTEDAKEAQQAFVQKRKPVFTGR
ncbi:short chain enoyl-CoA hydratase [Faunimonas pinastri]|uniref:Short chain enoyl-CoA hydratase n=1 Tax=Faunimonas pinastri TaxID=1855383 RepID=A0A1H9ECF4_9HYPH|nr:enoyl-CoA hydratase/isomerase family protein [Faunimonas pinastri]SEQ23351.1 short chain enoyl-CoA hydratase [Faunimonas pinastri]